MSRLAKDIAETVVVMKKKDIFIKWIIILLPYILTATFFIGGAWVTFKGGGDNQTDNSETIDALKCEMEDELDEVDIRIDNTNIRIDNTNNRIDWLIQNNIENK